MSLSTFIISDALSLYGKPLVAENAEELFQLVCKNRAFLRKWLGWIDTTVSSESSKVFIANCRTHAEAKTGFTFGLFLKDKLIGMVSLDAVTPAPEEKYSAKIGYWLDEGYQGKGIVTLAIHKLISFGIEQNIHNFNIFCGTTNVASRGVAAKLNFKHVGIKKDAEWLYDHYVDHDIFEINSTEWDKCRHQLSVLLADECVRKYRLKHQESLGM